MDQRAVRDRFRKLLTQFRKKDREERCASGISPEQTELDSLLEELNAPNEASATTAAETGVEEKRKLEADKEAAEEMRKRAMENLSQTKKRSANEQDGPKRKYRKGGNSALEYLKEKGEKERKKLKEESVKLEKERMDLQKESNERFMSQQNNMLAAMMEWQKQQNEQMQANQMILMQQQQQQGPVLMALLAKLVEK